MQSAHTWSNALAVGTLLLSLAALLLSAGAEHAALFSAQPMVLPWVGFALPAGLFHVAIPFLIAAGHRAAIWRGCLRPVARLSLTAAAILGTGSVWLTDLVLHDRWLTLYHSALLLGILLPRRRRAFSLTRLAAIAAAAGLIASVGYGAVWGETRCDEPSAVRCLEETGLRVWVPSTLDKLGLSAFADLRATDLRGISLRERDLRYADLRGADLRGADLSGANLRRARLDGVRAAGSMWKAAYLDGAGMVRAELRASDMREVHAYRLDLRAADLGDADLRDANLSHTYLAGTRFDGARLQDAYLRFAEGLVPGQLSDACVDGRTRLPDGVPKPVCSGP
jgi:hypothetical protein